jgi:hypothetical protein
MEELYNWQGTWIIAGVAILVGACWGLIEWLGRRGR